MCVYRMNVVCHDSEVLNCGCEVNKIFSNKVMFRLKTLSILGSKADLASLPEGKLLINTINAHSFNTAKKDSLFAEALTNGDALIPDGVSIVKACKWIKAKSQPKERIAGWDLFFFEMNKLEKESEERRGKSEESNSTEEQKKDHINRLYGVCPTQHSTLNIQHFYITLAYSHAS